MQPSIESTSSYIEHPLPSIPPSAETPFGTLLVVVPVVMYGLKEWIAFEMSKRNQRLCAELEQQKIEQQEKIAQIDYLEAQNQKLLSALPCLKAVAERDADR